MRCKYCGEFLEPADTHCPVCGKPVAPPRKKAPARKPQTSSIKLPQLEKFSKKYERDAVRSRTIQTVTIALLLAVAVLSVMMYLGMGELQTSLEMLHRTSETLLESQREQPTAAPEIQTDPTEAAQQPAQSQSLSQQKMVAALMLRRSGDATYAAAELDLGEWTDKATAWVSTAGEYPSRSTSAAWILDGTGDRLDVTLTDETGGAQAWYFASLTWSLSGDTFKGLTDAACVWEYRLSGGEWEPLPITAITAIPGGCEVRLTQEDLAALLGQLAGAEIRCRVSMAHPDGGALGILAGGLELEALSAETGG